MKKILFLSFLLISLTSLANNVLAKINNKIIVKIENKIITSYELKNKILTVLFLAQSEVNQENINSLKKRAVESLIQLKLKKIELDKFGIKKDNERIKTYLNSISSNNISDLKIKFLENNLDFELFLSEVEIETMWTPFIYKFYSKNIEIDENIIDKELKEYVKNNSSLKEFKISEIEILLNNDEMDNEKIINLQKMIKEQSFETAALKYSISSTASNKGDLGWINAKSLSEQIYNAIKKVKIGEISKPIRRQNSVLFLKVNDIKTSNIEDINLIDLKKKLINQKKNELVELYSLSHLSKIRNTSSVEYK
jgi:peptidyl-prolyl cis-trans isomerase SurA|tara:strand:- start:308 stop:1237 length:930 start_codon:yes stop_codon:yes gene_type:complete